VRGGRGDAEASPPSLFCQSLRGPDGLFGRAFSLPNGRLPPVPGERGGRLEPPFRFFLLSFMRC
jgi:hypothetical protein